MDNVIRLCGLSLLLLAYSNLVTAATCGEPSSEFTALGEHYFDLNSQARKTPPAPDELPAALVEILTNAKFSSGTGERSECHIINGESEQSTISFELEKINVSTRKDEVVINATELNTQKQHEHTDSIAIPLQKERLELIDENQLNASKRVRQNGASGSYLEEIQLQAKGADGQLEIKQWRYVNGELADWMSWSMNP